MNPQELDYLGHELKKCFGAGECQIFETAKGFDLGAGRSLQLHLSYRIDIPHTTPNHLVLEAIADAAHDIADKITIGKVEKVQDLATDLQKEIVALKEEIQTLNKYKIFVEISKEINGVSDVAKTNAK